MGEKDKFFYVWFDVLIGYMGLFKNLCDKCGDLDFNEYWNKDSKIEFYYFIGKDIVYFYSLFWFVMFDGFGFCKLINVFVYGYVIVNGVKMFKLKGMFVKVSIYLNYLDLECLCYYYVVKLNNCIDDFDLNFEDFI